MLLSLFLSAPALADCTPKELDRLLDRAATAYVSGDPKKLGDFTKSVDKTARCTELTPELAARVHLTHALNHVLDNNWEDTKVDLRSSIAALPLMSLPDELFRDQRLHLAWLRAQEEQIVWTESPPSLANGLVAPLKPDTPVLGKGGGNAKLPVRVTAVVVGAAGLGLYGAAWSSRTRYDSALDAGDNANALKHYRTTNGLSLASVGAGVLGAGLLGVSFAL